MSAPGGVVSAVRRGSLAEEAGIAVGDVVLAIDGRAPRDVIDYQFWQAEPEVTVHLRKADGLDDLVVFEKAIDEDLGIEFERATWDDVTLCNNNCFFCFLKGLPKGMRKSLYMKDDDYRLSFLHGNFVTLTNLEEADWARIAEQRLSPLNVSVHATGLALRRRMLANPKAPDVVEQLRRLGSLGLQAHTQIVLCPGVNDGSELDRSIEALAALYPAVQTVSVVPVGASPRLEDWSLQRDGIALVRPSAAYARTVIAQVGRWQTALRGQHGRSIVFCSDEYYVTSGERTPAARHYDGFPQYENGIGMVRTMVEDWRRTKRTIERRGQAGSLRGRRAAIACGTLIGPFLQGLGHEFGALTGAAVEIVPVVNRVFGERVNVSGLLCGRDQVDALAGREVDWAILPRPSLDYFGERFLDSMTVAEAEAALGTPVAFASQWSEVYDILARGGTARPGRNAAPNGAMWSEQREALPAGAAWE